MTMVTDLEHQLQGPRGAEARQALLVRLRDIEQRLQGRIRRGLPPDEFDQIRACVQACAAAQQVVQTYGQHARTP